MSNKKPNIKNNTPPQFSKVIEEFIALFDGAIKDYDWCHDNVRKMDQLTQDYLHSLELDGLDYKERAKVATAIAKCRQERRACKDTTEVLEPVVLFLNSDRGKDMMKLVREALGKTRKAEEKMEHKQYYPRVLTKNGYGGDINDEKRIGK